jgi:hypothetical protein
MKRIISLLNLLLILNISGFSQLDAAHDQLTERNTDTIIGWNFGGKFKLDMSQVGLVNWNKGGKNTITGITNLSMHLNYIQKDFHWANLFEMGYGGQIIGSKYSKAEDRIQFTSKVGKSAGKKWYYTGLLDFKTQMTAGYNPDDDSLKTSNWMAPGYLFLSAGMDFIPHKDLSIFLSPLTYRSTYVMDRELSDSGSFGLDPGQKIMHEIGAYIKFFYKHEILKNVTFQTNLDLYSNYLKNPQNIDVDWRVLLDMKINSFLTASISTHLIYDDDVKFKYDSNGDGNLDAEGPRVQFKEIIAIGLSFEF